MDTNRNPARQVLIVWGVFFVINILINGSIPFALGADLRAWKESSISNILFGFVQYAMMFMVVPLILIKGWETVRQPAFLIPLCIAIVAITFALVYRGVMAIAVLVLAYLHWRFDLSEYGIRSHGWKGDALVVVMIGFIYSVPSLLRLTSPSFDFAPALMAGLDRLFANPASTVENLFYFGFITERLSQKTGRWLTPFLIGAMYAAHEMTNPEYWYEGMNFVLVFIGVAVYASIYLWRRSVVAIWLGDGLGRFISKLF